MIELYNEFFSNEEFDFLHRSAVDIIMDKTQEFRVNIHAWEPNLIDSSAAPLLFKDIHKGTDERNIIENALKKKLDIEDKCDIYFFFSLPGSCIEWHNDVNQFAITIYLNDVWDIHDGGYFMYKDDGDRGIIKAIPPTPNLAVVQRDNIWHRTTKSSKNSPVRMSIQIFREYDVDI